MAVYKQKNYLFLLFFLTGLQSIIGDSLTPILKKNLKKYSAVIETIPETLAREKQILERKQSLRHLEENFKKADLWSKILNRGRLALEKSRYENLIRQKIKQRRVLLQSIREFLRHSEKLKKRIVNGKKAETRKFALKPFILQKKLIPLINIELKLEQRINSLIQKLKPLAIKPEQLGSYTIRITGK
ncbi:hypothetical protein ACFL35_14935 [Candidatus Riflebacteria bacterium]